MYKLLFISISTSINKYLFCQTKIRHLKLFVSSLFLYLFFGQTLLSNAQISLPNNIQAYFTNEGPKIDGVLSQMARLF
jgi:hypothetical protein